jgi:hypothetical protein
MCSNIPDEPSQYATVISHILVIKEDGEWFLDGRDSENNYTEACWSYDTWAEAMADVPDFIRALTEDYGVTIEWRKRCTAMCAGGGYAFICTRWHHDAGHHHGRAVPLSHVVTGLAS